MAAPRSTASYLKDKNILALSKLDDQELLAALEVITNPSFSLRQFLKNELSKRPKIYSELAYVVARIERNG
jgi:hypothetical protein